MSSEKTEWDSKAWYEGLTVKQLQEILEGHSINEWREVMCGSFWPPDPTEEDLNSDRYVHDGSPENDWDVVYNKYANQFGWEDVQDEYRKFCTELDKLAAWRASARRRRPESSAPR